MSAEKSSKTIRDLTTRFVEHFRTRESAYFVAVVPNGETPSGDLGVAMCVRSSQLVTAHMRLRPCSPMRVRDAHGAASPWL